MRFIRVDLPEPDGPMMATYSLLLDAQVDAAQGVDLLFGAHVVGAPEVLDDDHVAVRSSGLLHFHLGDDAVQSHVNLILCCLVVPAPCEKILTFNRLDFCCDVRPWSPLSVPVPYLSSQARHFSRCAEFCTDR